MPLTQVNPGLLDTQAQYTGFKNRIINGAMGIWQRGTSGFTSSGNYSADRWLISTGTSLSAVGQSSDVPTGYQYSLSVSGTNVPSARQYIESKNCTDLVGQSVTVSVWIKQTSGAGSNAMYIYLAHANTTDNFSGLTQIGSTTNITTTSSWVQYTATFTNLPAGAANGVALIIGSNSSGASTFLITGVQLEKGSTATSFDYRPYGTELALCQRYCFRMATTSNYGPYGMGHGTGGTTNFRTLIKTAQTMRAQPSLSFSAANTFQWGFGNVLTAISAAEYGVDAFSVGCDTTGVTGNGAYMLTSANNTNSFILATAEL